MKENKCKVCSLFEERNLIDEVRLDINKLIKSKQPSDILNKQTNFNLSDHYYKKHRNICLSNFEIPINSINDENNKNTESTLKTRKSYQEMLNIEFIMNQYKEMSFDDKQKHKLNLLEEIEYLVISNVHYQLITGCIDVHFKHLVPKEDISSLKVINDIMKTKLEETKTIHEDQYLHLLLPEQMDAVNTWVAENIEKDKKLKNNEF